MSTLGFDDVKQQIQSVVQAQIAQFTQRNDLRLDPTDLAQVARYPWVALILITGADIKVTFKIYFKVRGAQSMIAPMFKLSASQVPTEDAVDFVRESCNLVAGRLKTVWAGLGFKTGISLPVVTRAFDDLFFSPTQAIEHALYWRLSATNSGALQEEILVGAWIETHPNLKEKGKEREGSG